MSYAARLRSALAGPDRETLRRSAALAAQLQLPIYLVGGPVRDCLLGRAVVDLDLTVEGDALALARSLARELGGTVTTHDQFGTAKVRRPGRERSIDVAMTRTETYPHPGALPEVARGTIAADLSRRDFTINAMALRLDGEHFGELVDLYGGERDLQRQIVRVLHARSFVDDPTRLFRAARFEQRFEFAVEPATRALIPAALPVIDQVSGDRLRHEFELIFREPRPAKSLQRLSEWQVLRQVDPALDVDSWAVAQFQLQPGPIEPFTAWVWLLGRLEPSPVQRICRRLNLRREDAEDMVQVTGLAIAGQTIGRAASRSAVYRHLERISVRALEAALTIIQDPAARANVKLFLDELRAVKPALDGADLQALGQKPGPALGRMLEQLRDGRLDGKLRSREDEERYARELIEQEVEQDGT